MVTFVNPPLATNTPYNRFNDSFLSTDTENRTPDTNYPYKLAIIADRKGDLSKRWYVGFYVWDLGKNKMVRVQEYGDLTKHKSYQSRYRAALSLKNKIDSILKEGYVINSLLDEKQFTQAKEEQKRRENLTIIQAFELALKLKKNEISPNTVKAYNTTLERFREYLNAKRLHHQLIQSISPRLVNGYFDWLKAEKNVSNATANNYRTYFRTLVNVLIEREEIIKIDPSRNVPKLKTKSAYHEIYLDDQIEDIKKHLTTENPHLWLLCQFVYYCFLRPRKEARLIQIKHIKQNNVLAITEDISKTDIRFPIIPTALQSALSQWKLEQYPNDYYLFSQGGRPGPVPPYINYWGKQWLKVREALGLSENMTLYSWKHTGACKLYLATKDPNKVREQCGHTSLETTLVYLRQLGMFDNKEVENLFPEI